MAGRWMRECVRGRMSFDRGRFTSKDDVPDGHGDGSDEDGTEQIGDHDYGLHDVPGRW